MQSMLSLQVSLFHSALETIAVPDLDDGPWRIQLMIAGFEAPFDLDCVSATPNDTDPDSLKLTCRCVFSDVDYSSLTSGVDFFMHDSGKLIGRGQVC